MFNKPIPGQSLTSSPGKMPYERPPEITNVKEAADMHLDRLSQPKAVKGLLDALETGIDVVTLTEGYLRSAVANGIHSIDVSMTVAPIIHEHIKKLADNVGIDYEEGLVDEEEEKTKRHQIELAKAKFKREKARGNKTETVQEEVLPPANEGPPDDDTSGFMKRRPQ